MNWLIPSNPKIYKSIDAFKELKRIDQKQSANYNIGDTIFIYSGIPDQKIVIKAKVLKINIPFDKTINDEKFWINSRKIEIFKNKLFARLELVELYKGNTLALSVLKQNGLSSAPQGPIKVTGELFSYINEKFKSFDNIIYPNELEAQDSLYEGAKKTVVVNTYERNPIARRKCVEHYGAVCKVCEFDFEKKYGDLGKGFIHVHHIVPISDINKSYEIDYKKDLIPVCPNCHAMLHQKNDNGEYYTYQELKRLLK